jgi:hypothetical protein
VIRIRDGDGTFADGAVHGARNGLQNFGKVGRIKFRFSGFGKDKVKTEN